MNQVTTNQLTKKRKKKGFTLIELIAVIAIIGILAAVLVPKIVGYMNDAKDAKVIAQARNVLMGYETMISKGATLDSNATLVDVDAIEAEFTTPTATGITSWAEYMSISSTDTDKLKGDATMADLKTATSSGTVGSIAATS